MYVFEIKTHVPTGAMEEAVEKLQKSINSGKLPDRRSIAVAIRTLKDVIAGWNKFSDDLDLMFSKLEGTYKGDD